MSEDGMELIGRAVRPRRNGKSVRNVEVASRVVQRREAIFKILDAAYHRDLSGRSSAGVERSL